MPYGFVQQKEFSENRSTASAASFSTGAFDTPLTAGNLLVVLVWYGGGNGPRTITLSGGGSPTWIEDTGVKGGANGAWLHAFYAYNIPGGTTAQITATPSGTVEYPCILVAEFSGFATTSARLAGVGQHQATPTTATDAVTSGLLGTLASQPAGIIALSNNEQSDGTPVAGTGFTGQAGVWTFQGAVPASARLEHRRVTATTSVAGTFTSTNQPHKTWAWAFAEAAGGGITGTLGATESGSDVLAASGNLANNGVRLTLRDTDTGALAANLTGLIVSVRATSNATSVLASTTSGTTNASGVFELPSGAVGNPGDYVYATVEKSDHSIVAAYRVPVVDLNA